MPMLSAAAGGEKRAAQKRMPTTTAGSRQELPHSILAGALSLSLSVARSLVTARPAVAVPGETRLSSGGLVLQLQLQCGLAAVTAWRRWFTGHGGGRGPGGACAFWSYEAAEGERTWTRTAASNWRKRNRVRLPHVSRRQRCRAWNAERAPNPSAF
jgi:hypothetical protein